MKNIKDFFKPQTYFFWFYIAFFFLFFIFIFSHSIGKKLKDFFLSEHQTSHQTSRIPPPLAQILDFKGKIHWKARGSDHSFQPLKKNKKSLNHWEQIRLDKNSYLTLSFSSGHKIKVFDESEIFLEYWNSIEPPVYLHLIYGNFDLLENKGKKGKLFIVQNGKIFRPSKRPKKIETKTTQVHTSLFHLKGLKKSDPLNSHQQKLNTESKRLPQFEQSKEIPVSYEFSNTKKNRNAVLTNLSIERKLKSFRHKFKKCQFNALKNKKKPYGKTLLGLLIEPSGKIQKLNVIESSVPSKDLEQCIFTILKTVSFHPFQAPPVYAIYALNFEEEK